MKKIWDSRRTYKEKQLNEHLINKTPFELFQQWFEEAQEKEQFEANAMILSTIDNHKQPHSRVVLLRNFDEQGFVFFSNYNSDKANQIKTNKKVALLFFWQSLSRQVRVLGKVKKTNKDLSDKYFYSRPFEHQCGSIASPQSKVIKSKDDILDVYKNCLQQKIVKRPKNWGGYIVEPIYFEFWQGQPSRLHDRIVFKKQKNNDWKIFRLAP